MPFDFPLAALPIEQRAELRRRLARLPGPLAQAVLDEYNSALGRRIRFRNRWGWFGVHQLNGAERCLATGNAAVYYRASVRFPRRRTLLW